MMQNERLPNMFCMFFFVSQCLRNKKKGSYLIYKKKLIAGMTSEEEPPPPYSFFPPEWLSPLTHVRMTRIEGFRRFPPFFQQRPCNHIFPVEHFRKQGPSTLALREFRVAAVAVATMVQSKSTKSRTSSSFSSSSHARRTSKHRCVPLG